MQLSSKETYTVFMCNDEGFFDIATVGRSKGFCWLFKEMRAFLGYI